MQIIPIIISEKILKKIFLDSIDQINKYFNFNYEILDEFAKINKNPTAIILDSGNLKNIPNDKITNQKLFIINNDSCNQFDQNRNQILIDRPFKISELFSLVENNIDQIKKREQKKIKFNQHIYDPLSRIFQKDKKFIRLTEKESEILLSLIDSNNTYMSKKLLLNKVWKYSEEIDTHTLETHLYSLRKKIEEKLGTKNLIIHEEKKGYFINKELL